MQIAVVGKGMPLTILEEASIQPYIAALKEEDQSMAGEATADAQPPQQQQGATPGAVSRCVMLDRGRRGYC